MCKNFFMIGITNPTNAMKMAKAMAPLMSVGNQDGIGYAALTNEGKIFSEKWLENKMAFFTENDYRLTETLGAMTGWLRTKDNYMTSGVIEKDKISTFIMHTRHSTNKVCIENTHPFIINDNVITHNGVINNHTTFRKEVSSCDSEAILTQCIDKKVNENIKNFNEVSGAISGWYACAYISKHDDVWSVDVFRYSANLYACYVEDIGAIVFSTSDEDLRKALDYCGFKSSKIFNTYEKIITRFNAITGERLDQTDFKSYTYSYSSNKGNKGYGRDYELDDDEYYQRNYGQSKVAGGQQEASDSKYLPRYTVGKFTIDDIDELEEIYDGLPKERQEMIDAITELEDRYKALDSIRASDAKQANKK